MIIYLQIDESVDYPKEHLDLYSSTKAAAEKLVLSYKKNKANMKVIALCPTAVFGIGDKYLSDELKAQQPFIIGEGLHYFDYVPVENVAFAHVLAEQAINSEKRDKVNGNAYFIGNDEKHQYRWFNGYNFSGGETESHWKQPIAIHIPLPVMYMFVYFNIFAYYLTGFAPLDVIVNIASIIYTQRTYLFNSSEAKTDLGCAPVMSIKEGIRHTVMKSRNKM